jgi:hypothetical protein
MSVVDGRGLLVMTEDVFGDVSIIVGVRVGVRVGVVLHGLLVEVEHVVVVVLVIDYLFQPEG